LRQEYLYAEGLKNLFGIAKITHIPFQVFHESNDFVVPAEVSRNTVNSLRENGGIVEYTEYEGAYHWI